MKIILLNTDDFTGGAAIAARRLLTALSKRKINTKLLVQDSKSGQENVVAIDDNWLKQKMSFVRFVLERLWFWPYEKSKEVRFQFNLSRFGQDISENQLIKEADVVHLNWINFGFLSINSLQKLFKTKKPIVWTLHDMWAFTGGCHHSGDCENYQQACGNCERFLKNPSPDDLSHQVWKQKMSAFQNANLTVVTCSEWLGNRARKSSLFQNIKVITIPNPIDIDVFRPIVKSEARQKLGLDTHKNYILFAAMRVEAIGKGFSYFKSALEIYRQSAPENTELLVFGQVDEATLQDLPFKVNALGRLTDIEKIVLAYCAASVFVIPSLEENLPNTIMESLACGTPVVGFEVGGIPEMVEHQKNGYVANYKSAEDLATGMNWVLQNTDYEVLCSNSRQKVVENYSEEIVVKQYEELYKSLI